MEKPFKTKGKVVLITGSMSGIGLETAKLFLKENIKGLILLDIIKNDNILTELEAISNGAKIMYRNCDLSKQQDLKEAYDYAWNIFGYIHLAVHSAGIANENDIRKIVSINVAGVVEGSVWLWNKMRKDTGGEGGTIINISSLAGIIDMTAAPIYSATKQAICCFSRSLGNSLHYDRAYVRVLAVCPGVTLTSLVMKPILRFDGEINEDFDALTKAMALQKPESVANVILEIYKNAESGTTWISHKDLPAIQYCHKEERELIEAVMMK